MRLLIWLLFHTLVSIVPGRTDLLAEIDRAIAENRYSEALGIARTDLVAPAWLSDYVGAYALLSRGESRIATDTARALLGARPNNVRARHLLIHCLIAQKSYRAAVFHIRRNLSVSGDPVVRAQYEGLLARYDKANPSFGMSLSMGANPSTNVTRGSAQETVTINGLPFRVGEESQEQAGGTVTAGLSVFKSFEVGERTDLVLSKTAQLETGVSGETSDIVTLAPSLQVVHRLDKILLSAGPVAEFQWVEGDAYVRRFGGSASATRIIANNLSVTVSLRLLDQDYEDAEFLDGWRLTSALTLRKSLTETLKASLALKYEHEDTDAGHLTYDFGEVRATVEKQWDNGFYTDFSLSYGIKPYEEDFPLAGESRRDDRYEVQVGAAHRRISLFGVMPYIGYRYTRNASNISLYDFDSNDLIISGRKRF